MKYTKLDMRPMQPMDGKKFRSGEPFIVMLYLSGEGQYITWGRHVHRTIMWRNNEG